MKIKFGSRGIEFLDSFSPKKELLWVFKGKRDIEDNQVIPNEGNYQVKRLNMKRLHEKVHIKNVLYKHYKPSGICRDFIESWSRKFNNMVRDELRKFPNVWFLSMITEKMKLFWRFIKVIMFKFVQSVREWIFYEFIRFFKNLMVHNCTWKSSFGVGKNILKRILMRNLKFYGRVNQFFGNF